MKIINTKPKARTRAGEVVPKDERTIPCGNCGERMDLRKGTYCCRNTKCSLVCDK